MNTTTPPLLIAVASHKPYAMPDDPVYVPVQVGAAGRDSIPGFRRDDEGENISERNAGWCELTGLYWMWKNLEADALGLVHYRRRFKASSGRLAELVAERGVVLPVARNYFIETTRSQYVHAHHAQDLDVAREIIAERHPAFLPAFDRAMASTRGHRFNMFIMRRDLFDDYCTWLFDVLFELERRLDTSSYSPYDARVFGFVGERLLDVWFGAKGIGYAEVPVRHLEGQNWPLKIFRFLWRKMSRH